MIEKKLSYHYIKWTFTFIFSWIDLINTKPNVTLITSIYQIRCVYGICGWTTLKSELKVPRTSFVAMLVPDDLTSCNQTFVPWKKQNPALFRRLDALFLPLSCKFHSESFEKFWMKKNTDCREENLREPLYFYEVIH